MDYQEALELYTNLRPGNAWLEHQVAHNDIREEDLPKILDPSNTWIDLNAKIGAGTLVLPFCVIMGASEIGKNCLVWPHTVCINVLAGNGVTLGLPHQKNSVISDNCVIGRLAEFNRTIFKKGAKMAHHGYLGDTDLGERSNVGAGFITANYDGKKKHATIIGADSLLGVNANSISPNEYPQGTLIAGGTTVPANYAKKKGLRPWSVIVALAAKIIIGARKSGS